MLKDSHSKTRTPKCGHTLAPGHAGTRGRGLKNQKNEQPNQYTFHLYIVRSYNYSDYYKILFILDRRLKQ